MNVLPSIFAFIIVFRTRLVFNRHYLFSWGSLIMPQKEVSILSSINLHNELFHLIANALTNKVMYTDEEDGCCNQQCLMYYCVLQPISMIYCSQLTSMHTSVYLCLYAKILNQSCPSALKWWSVKLKLIPSMAYIKKQWKTI